MGKEQEKKVIVQIKKDPTFFIPSKEELERVIELREQADRKLKEAGITVIL